MNLCFSIGELARGASRPDGRQRCNAAEVTDCYPDQQDGTTDIRPVPHKESKMNEIKMPVQVFRGDSEIGSGELLPNGANLAFCPDDKKFELLKFKTDTRQVEDRIPMKFFCDEKEVSSGELYNSGEYVCLCPEKQDLSLIKPESSARLFVDEKGHSARLEVSTRSH